MGSMPSSLSSLAWSIIKQDVYHAILDFFDHGQMLKQWNLTTITLVPKVQHPSFVCEGIQTYSIACCTKKFSEVGLHLLWGAQDLAHMQEILSIPVGEFPIRYLGVPLTYQKWTIQQCKPLVEKVIGKIQGWSTRFLSYAGRLKMINEFIRMNLINPYYPTRDINNLSPLYYHDNEYPMPSDYLADYFLNSLSPTIEKKIWDKKVSDFVQYYNNYVEAVCGNQSLDSGEKLKKFKELLENRSHNYSVHY